MLEGSEGPQVLLVLVLVHLAEEGLSPSWQQLMTVELSPLALLPPVACRALSCSSDSRASAFPACADQLQDAGDLG